MKPSILLLATVSSVIIGCVHKAEHFTPPDASAMLQQAARLDKAVATSKTIAKTVQTHINEIQKAHQEEKALTLTITPKLADLTRVAPPELQPLIQGVTDDVTHLQLMQNAEELKITQVIGEQTNLAGQLEEANAARNELIVNAIPKYIAEAQAMTAGRNADQVAWEKDATELQKLKSESLLRKVLTWLAIIGGLALVVFIGVTKVMR